MLSRVEFGKMKTLIRINGYANHMELDMSNESIILFADRWAVKSTDGKVSKILAGSDFQSGYYEGTEAAARFSEISDFTQINTTTLLLTDSKNNCLRFLNRINLWTSKFVGWCQYSGFQDGLNALFKFPFSIVKDKRSSTKFFVADRDNHALRLVDLASKITSTIFSQTSGLSYPKKMAYDFSGKNLIITNGYDLQKYDLHQNTLSLITGKNALQHWPRELLILSKNLILVTDEHHHKLQLMNLDNGSKSSICCGTASLLDGSVKSCQLNYPFSLMIRGDTIYVGQIGAIRTIKSK